LHDQVERARRGLEAVEHARNPRMRELAEHARLALEQIEALPAGAALAREHELLRAGDRGRGSRLGALVHHQVRPPLTAGPELRPQPPPLVKERSVEVRRGHRREYSRDRSQGSTSGPGAYTPTRG